MILRGIEVNSRNPGSEIHWFLYNRGLRHERVNKLTRLSLRYMCYVNSSQSWFELTFQSCILKYYMIKIYSF